jgi:hypothetical protein
MPAARFRRRTPALILAAGLTSLGLAALFSTAGATTLRKMDLPELVAGSDRVVYARVTGNTVFWDEEGTMIHTNTTFQVLTDAKGAGDATLTVTMVGGRIDPFEVTEDGRPIFQDGEEVVLFALDRGDGLFNLTGYSQGVMRVQLEPESGEKFALSQVPLGVSFVSGPQLREVRPSPLRERLDTVLDEVRRITAGSSTGPVVSPVPDTDPLGPEGGAQ